MPSAPTDWPRNTVPSLSTRMAARACVTNNLLIYGQMWKAGQAVDPSRCLEEKLYAKGTTPQRRKPRLVYLLLKPEHVVHVEETALPSHDVACGPHGALRIGRTARRAVRDFDALADTRKKRGMVAHEIAAAQCRQSYRAASSLPRRAVTVVYRAFGQCSTKRPCHHFTHSEGGARWGIDFMLVMSFHDFDVITVAQRGGRDTQQLEHQVDAHTHVRREDDRNFLSRGRDRLSLLFVETGGADHHLDALPG